MSEMPKSVELAYSSELANVNFIKNQEWKFTSSALVVYAAIVASTKTIPFNDSGKYLLCLVLFFSWIFCVAIYWGMANSLRKSREEIDKILEGPYFNLGKQKERRGFDKWGVFVALAIIAGVGAIISGYAVLNASSIHILCD